MAKSGQSFSLRLESELYNEENLVEIKAPLRLPYYNTNTGYEKVRGEIEVDGKHYNYVKRKISNDTLYILCITNNAKNRLSESHRDYAKLVTDAAGDDNEKETAKKTKFGVEYNQPRAFISISPQKILHKKEGIRSAFFHDNANIDESFRPPEQVVS